MKRSLLAFYLLFSCYAATLAQTAKTWGAAEILQGIEKLNVVGGVLYIAAHPDDENTRLLAYLASEKKLRTAYLSLTRGDGGQNLVGKEQGEMLGLIRTQELLAARRTDGAEQFFTRANDFGYSKNPEETFRIWNKDSVLSDVVLAIRKFKPDVIICRFPTTGEGGHGHHTASAILALEAFDAAADPARFPHQLKQTQVWQTKRIFWNTFNFGTTNTTSPNQLKVDVGLYNEPLGKSYGEIAAESRSMHKSQGFGAAKQRGSNIEYFKFLKGDSVKKDLFEGINNSWGRFKGTENINTLIVKCMQNFGPRLPEKTVKDLADLYKEIQKLEDPELKFWKSIKSKEIVDLITGCCGLWLEALSSEYSGVSGQQVEVSVQAVNRSNLPVRIRGVSFLNSFDTIPNLVLPPNEFISFKHREKLREGLPFSNPYWLNEEHAEGLYTVKDPMLIGRPQNESACKVHFMVDIEGLELKIERDLVNKFTDPVKGEIYRPFEVLPAVTINFPEKNFVFASTASKTIQLIVKANMPNVSGKITLNKPEGWNFEIKNPAIEIAVKGGEAFVDVVVKPAKGAGRATMEASVTIGDISCNKSITRVEYDHIPYQFILAEARAGLVYVDVTTAKEEIGYIPGAGDDVAACLKQIGYNVTLLDEQMLKSAELSKFKAIVTGIRAYNTNDKLQALHGRLMDYVKKGGNLVVQYNTNSRVGPLQAKIGPYPFNISRDRVTDEKAEIRFKDAKHPVLNRPNKIGPADFEGWVQERGIYFASEIDKNYQTVLSLNDAGEKESQGSLIIAPFGKGNFVYTGLVFFRELPAGVPGAYRLFVNLLSLPKN